MRCPECGGSYLPELKKCPHCEGAGAVKAPEEKKKAPKKKAPPKKTS